ncbi:MAG TPA: 50S ribosomal protein L22 [Candidatus Paceibacterota bacterium]|nr:50S ribosomal protein L22 [Candidatus Paceibacterota bacterium]
MKAYLKNYRQSPRKVRLVANLIKGMKANEAQIELDFLAKRAGEPIKKLLSSAISNAQQMGIDKNSLFVKEVRVDKGIVMKRFMPAAMGSAHRINKRTSHVTLVLGIKGEKVANKKEAKKEEAAKPVKAVKASKTEGTKEVKKSEKKSEKKVEKTEVKKPAKAKVAKK